jgi:NAD(P)-dependent dehydrogenase (short-subunit alcohol dehydrogenase family)
MPTVLITWLFLGLWSRNRPALSGESWNVVATMRQPKADILPASDRLTVLPLDVTDPASIAALAQAGDIDVLVNNAGFGAAVPIELIEPDTARNCSRPTPWARWRCCRPFCPNSANVAAAPSSTSHQRSRSPLPLVSVYRASKAAVNALTESLAVEMQPFGVRCTSSCPDARPRRISATMPCRTCVGSITPITSR